jgi:hypothetical protein
MITNDVHAKLKSRIAVAKATFNKTTFYRKLDLNLRKERVNCYIWSLALYGAETLTLRKVDQKYLGLCEMRCGRGLEIRWTNAKNEDL